MNYLVMECRSAYAVVLADDGRFIKVANMRYEVGQTVTEILELNLPQSEQPPVRSSSRRWLSSLTAIAACLMLVFTSLFFMNQLPYASVYLTINPQVRIDVNRKDMVVGVEGVNADGETLLAGYDHRKKDLDTVMDELVDLAIDMGYLHEGGTITLTLDADENWVISHGEALTNHLSDYLTDKISVTIDVESSAPAPTAPAASIVIPVDPDGYQDSDYGETLPPEATPQIPAGDSGYADDDSQSNYGVSSYEEPSDDGQSFYEEERGDSGYDMPSADDGQSGYGSPPESNDDSDDGDSGYNDSAYGSNYESNEDDE